MAGGACVVATRGRGGLGVRDVDAPNLHRHGLLPETVIIVCMFRMLVGRGRVREAVLLVVDVYTPKTGTVF